jgi:hypothetical protein
MWNKIKNPNEIKAGIAINQYPVEGNPVDEINMNDGRNLLSFQVADIKEVDGPNDVINLIIPTTEGPDIPEKVGLRIMESIGNATSLKKLRKEFVEDDCWWSYSVG